MRINAHTIKTKFISMRIHLLLSIGFIWIHKKTADKNIREDENMKNNLIFNFTFVTLTSTQSDLDNGGYAVNHVETEAWRAA